ncbi:MAG: hypothetical protein AB7D28_08825 [Candidatus Berkiella sp.]
MTHPYIKYENHEAWKNIEKSIKDLIENGDIECNTPTEYIVGYIIECLDKENFLSNPKEN